MTVDKIDVLDDPRVEYRNAYINGKNYGTYRTCMDRRLKSEVLLMRTAGYLYSQPDSGTTRGTVVLVRLMPLRYGKRN